MSECSADNQDAADAAAAAAEPVVTLSITPYGTWQVNVLIPGRRVRQFTAVRAYSPGAGRASVAELDEAAAIGLQNELARATGHYPVDPAMAVRVERWQSAVRELRQQLADELALVDGEPF